MNPSGLLFNERVNRGMPLTEVAKALGIEEAALEEWESNPQKIPLYKLATLAELYGLDPGDVIYGICDSAQSH